MHSTMTNCGIIENKRCGIIENNRWRMVKHLRSSYRSHTGHWNIFTHNSKMANWLKKGPKCTSPSRHSSKNRHSPKRTDHWPGVSHENSMMEHAAHIRQYGFKWIFFSLRHFSLDFFLLFTISNLPAALPEALNAHHLLVLKVPTFTSNFVDPVCGHESGMTSFEDIPVCCGRLESNMESGVVTLFEKLSIEWRQCGVNSEETFDVSSFCRSYLRWRSIVEMVMRVWVRWKSWKVCSYL